MRIGSERQGVGLRTRLVVLCTLLTVVAVTVSFVAVSVEIRRQTRLLLEDTLARHQKTAVALQARSLEQILRTSSLMAANPTLRAAIDTYRSESGDEAKDRPDLLRTIKVEADKLAEGLDRDLFVVTDFDGHVLAASGRSGTEIATGARLDSRTVVKRALNQPEAIGQDNFGIVTVKDVPYRVGCVPIVLQGYVIGTLMVGDRLDAAFATASRDTFGGDIVVTVGDRIVGSTMIGAAPDLRQLRNRVARVTVLGDEYVAAPLTLGTDEEGRTVSLCLLQSLTAALGPSYRAMVAALVFCGLLAVVGAGIGAWAISRSVLRPFESFVGFLHTVAESGDRSRRFDAASAGPEVQLLNTTFGRLIDAVEQHEQRLLQDARDEIVRIQRLKESEKLAALGRMLSGAAHEINNPLTGVIGNLQLLLGRKIDDTYVNRRLEKTYKEAQRIVALVRNLLKVAHRDGGARALVDVNRLLSETVEMRRHDFTAAGVGLELEPAQTRTRLFGNELELQQVVLNIVNNALDALKEAPAAGRALTIRTEANTEAITIVFADNGPGIKDPSKVFEHFYTTKEIGKGTGLGLSISYAIVNDHAGTIAAENGPLGGARFTIVLPAAAASQPAVTAPDPAEAQSRPSQQRASGTVLVVDDEADVLDLEMEILRNLGASVEGVSTGADAIALLLRREFDVVVSDLKMPGGVSGQDLFRWALQHQPATAERFVFVTGDTASDATREFLEQSGRRCVLKPFSRDELVNVIKESLDARPATV